jgi:hypothetical protein
MTVIAMIWNVVLNHCTADQRLGQVAFWNPLDLRILE